MPFEKGTFGSLDFRLYPGTVAWNTYEAEGVQAEDAPHVAANAKAFADYFDEQVFNNVNLFDGEPPGWVLNPQLLVAKWVYSAPPLPVNEGDMEAFSKRMANFVKRNKLPKSLRPAVIHCELPFLKACLHGYCSKEKVLIHVDSDEAPKSDEDYWIWHMTAMAYRTSLLVFCGFEVEKVVFGCEKFSRVISGERLETLNKIGSGLICMMHDCYNEFVINEEHPPIAA
jgi:hypothetical protein